ncbi:MAG: hypothetical protein H0T46_18565 [Deltaproteobacteria bacterium]|nr:hypothetical protein [Deltaproteobacteria bacterium]
MKVWLVALIAVAGIGTARIARGLAKDAAPHDDLTDAPFAPSPAAAPIVTLGYRELAAELLYVRLVGYFGSQDNEAHAMASLAEAIAALDPTFRRPYEIGAVAITAAKRGVDNAAHLRAIALLEQAVKQFPSYWKYPNLAGQIYLVDLKTDDEDQRRRWDEAGTLLLESAMRKPGAPASSASAVAELRSRLGQRQRALEGLREMLLVTNDAAARQRIIDKIAAISNENADEIAGELLEIRRRFESAWLTQRFVLPPSLFLLIGPKLEKGFDPADLATGGVKPLSVEGIERLEPLTDPPTLEDGPSSP